MWYRVKAKNPHLLIPYLFSNKIKKCKKEKIKLPFQTFKEFLLHKLHLINKLYLLSSS